MDIEKTASKLHSLIRDFTSLEVDERKAKDSYAALAKEYDDTRKNTVPGGTDRIPEGYCYRHNTENFSLFTGIFSLKMGDVRLLHKCGEDFLAKRVLGIIEKNSDRLHADKILTVPPHGELKNNLHLFTTESSMVVAALSSSPYFDEVFFTQSAIDIAGSIENETQPDNCAEIYNTIKTYIKNNIPLNAVVLAFPGLERIFSHMGIRTLIDISDHILRCAEGMYPNAKIIRISLAEFIVLGKTAKSIQSKFEYEGIFISHIKREMSLAQADDYYKLTELLFSVHE